MMEQSNKNQEQEIKSDDLAIASEGQQLGDQLLMGGGNTPQTNPAMQGLNNTNQEVQNGAI